VIEMSKWIDYSVTQDITPQEKEVFLELKKVTQNPSSPEELARVFNKAIEIVIEGLPRTADIWLREDLNPIIGKAPEGYDLREVPSPIYTHAIFDLFERGMFHFPKEVAIDFLLPLMKRKIKELYWKMARTAIRARKEGKIAEYANLTHAIGNFEAGITTQVKRIEEELGLRPPPWKRPR